MTSTIVSMSYSTFLENVRNFFYTDTSLTSFINFINYTKSCKKVDFIPILQCDINHSLIKNIQEYIELTIFLDKNNITDSSLYGYEFYLKFFNLNQDFDHNTVKMLEKIYDGNYSNLILICRNFDLSLEKNEWLSNLKYKLFEIDFPLSNDFNYAEFYRTKALQNKPKIVNEFCQNIIKKIIENMKIYSKNGVTQFDIKINCSIYNLYNNKEECVDKIVDLIRNDRKLNSSFFEISVGASSESDILFKIKY